jgi:DNA-binding MarR family transcriptional regulator
LLIGNYRRGGVTDIDPDDVARLRAVIGRLSRLLNASVSDVGLTPTQLSVLGSVVRRGPIGVGELADLEGINPTMLSRIVGKLCEAELILRVTDPGDGRAVRLQTTDAGAQLHRRAQDQRASLLSERLRHASPEQIAALMAALPTLELVTARDIDAPLGANR